MGKNSIIHVCVYICIMYYCTPLMCGYISTAKIFLVMGNCVGRLATNLGTSWLLLSMKNYSQCFVIYWLAVKMNTSIQHNMVLPQVRIRGQPQGSSSCSNIWFYPQVEVRGQPPGGNSKNLCVLFVK